MRCVILMRATGNEVCDATRRRWNVTVLSPASFEVERFELAGDACIEVRGRWSGVRGRRFMRPTLTAVADGREQRILALLDDKPWIAEEGEIWRAAFPCSTDPAALLDAELTVAPDVTVPLAPPSEPARASRRRPVRPPRAAGSESRATLEIEVPPELGELERRCEHLSSERDEARAARDEAARERDAVRAERDSAVQDRNRMLAERDTAHTRIEELARQWELTAALGTRRTLERDTVTVERDRLARDRDAALEERDRTAEERELAAEERDRTAEERDAALAELDSAARETTISLMQIEETRESRPLVLSDHDLGPPDLQMRCGEAESSQAWRARVLALSALLLAAIVLLVLVLAK